MYHSFITAALLFIGISLIHPSDFSVHLRRMQYLSGFSKQMKTKQVLGVGGQKHSYNVSMARTRRAPPSNGGAAARRASPLTKGQFFRKRYSFSGNIHNPQRRGRPGSWDKRKTDSSWGATGSESRTGKPGFQLSFFLFLPTTRKILTCEATVISQKQSYSRSRKSFLQSASLFFVLTCVILKNKTRAHSPRCVQANSKIGAQTVFFEFLHIRTNTHTQISLL